MRPRTSRAVGSTATSLKAFSERRDTRHTRTRPSWCAENTRPPAAASAFTDPSPRWPPKRAKRRRSGCCHATTSAAVDALSRNSPQRERQVTEPGCSRSTASAFHGPPTAPVEGIIGDASAVEGPVATASEEEEEPNEENEEEERKFGRGRGSRGTAIAARSCSGIAIVGFFLWRRWGARGGGRER
jgi:hypothetical protein